MLDHLPLTLDEVPLPEELPPLVMTPFVRPELLLLVLEGVMQQTLLPPKIIAFVDGAKRVKHEEPIKQSIQILKDFSLKLPIEIVMRERNLGCDENVFSAFEEVLSSHWSLVYLEDDDLPNPYFYERMCRVLQAYRHVPQVYSVGGYATLPKEIEDVITTDFIFSKRVFGWGFALWAERWQKLDLVGKHGYNPYQHFSKIPATIQSKHTIVNQFFMEKNEQIDWAITFALVTMSLGGCNIIPTKSLIKNIGFGHAESNTYRGAEADWVNSKYEPDFCPNSLPTGLELLLELSRTLTAVELIDHFRKTGGMWLNGQDLVNLLQRYPQDSLTILQFFAQKLPLLVSRLRRGLLV